MLGYCPWCLKMLSQSGQEVMFKPATSGLLFPIRPGAQLLSPSPTPPQKKCHRKVETSPAWAPVATRS
ncbi:hypothetical protein XFF6970_310003 [Xanthomonas citri pv. fuscans]|nr:hypothetical protein XFF6970_310003 [Xanthomonas citri pv. fuscans]